MTVTVVNDADGPLLEQAWTLYHDAFAELNAVAVQRHLMHRGEFDQVMADKRVQKYLTHDSGDRLTGLAAYTRDLDAAPLISPDYFERRWPDLYAQRRIWYCGFVAVHPGAQGRGVFGELVEAMWRTAADTGSIISLDMCRVNADGHRMARAVALMLDRLGGWTAERIDVQEYWLYQPGGGP